jgi:hypothetical protein
VDGRPKKLLNALYQIAHYIRSDSGAIPKNRQQGAYSLKNTVSEYPTKGEGSLTTKYTFLWAAGSKALPELWVNSRET